MPSIFNRTNDRMAVSEMSIATVDRWKNTPSSNDTEISSICNEPSRLLNQIRSSVVPEPTHFIIEDGELGEPFHMVEKRAQICCQCDSKDEEIEKYRNRIRTMQKALVKYRKKEKYLSTSKENLKKRVSELNKANEQNTEARKIIEVYLKFAKLWK